MSWQNRIDFERCELSPGSDAYSPSHMTPGLTDTYDQELREKASVRDTPIPVENMGLEGEYDRFGLAKRVAQALDRQGQLAHLDSLTLVQKGNSIAFWGEIPNQPMLESLVETTSKVDGTHAVDIAGVTVAQGR